MQCDSFETDKDIRRHAHQQIAERYSFVDITEVSTKINHNVNSSFGEAIFLVSSYIEYVK